MAIANWSAPLRPNEYAEQSLIVGFLDGTFPPGSTLPGERTLAEQLGVTRPTLREAIQRLARDGWITVRQGKATAVNNFWQEGGVNVLGALVLHSQHLPANFVTQLLEVRLQIAPAYIMAAVQQNPAKVSALLADYSSLKETAASFAAYDWRLHRQLSIASENPIYTLILNGFKDFYQQFAQHYFSSPKTRANSMKFYADLAKAAEDRNAQLAEKISRAAMTESITAWQAMNSQGD